MNKIIPFVLLAIPLLLSAQDSGQYLEGQSFYKDIENYSSKKNEEKIDTDVQAPKQTDFSQSNLLQGTPGSSSFVPIDASTSSISTSDEKTLSSKRREAKSNFGINYLLAGETKFTSDSGLFKRTFQDDPKAVHVGPIILGWERILGRAFIVPMIGLNAGLNFYRGRGSFSSDGSYSNAYFNLWMLPIDLGVGVGFRFWDFVGIKALAGPSVMGLIQVRNDLSSAEEGKSRRQVGTGYFAAGKFQFNLSRIVPSWGIEYYRDYKATGAYIDLIARMENYANFQDDIEISSTMIGLGFSFDFL